MSELKLFSGGKAVPLNALPESAWTVISGGGGEDRDKLRRVVGLLHRCVRLRAGAVQSVPWAVYRAGQSDALWDSAMAVPPELAWAKNLKKLLGLVEAALCIGSEAFVYAERRVNRVPTGLFWLSPLTTKPVWDKEAGLVGFERRLGADDVRRLDVRDVAYVWQQDPMHETKPDTSVVQAAAAAAGVLHGIDKFSAGFFERGAIKATLLTVDGNPSREERDRLKAWWSRFFSGVVRAWGTEVVSASVKAVPVGEGMGELTNSELTREKRDDILATFGIPQSLVFADSANFATAKQDKLNFYDETILPELDLIEPVLNDVVFNPAGYDFSFLHESMDIYQDDEGERAESLARYVAAGIPLHVAAEMLGLELPPGMDYEDLEPVAPPPTLTPSGGPTSGQSGGSGGIAAGATAVEAELRKWERKATRKFLETGSAVVDFESDHVPAHEAASIRAALARADSKRGVREAFLAGRRPGPEPGHSWPTDLESFKATLLALDPEDDEALEERGQRGRVEARARKRLETALGESLGALVSVGPADDPDLSAGMVAMEAVHRGAVADALRAALVESSDLGVRVASEQLAGGGVAFDWTLPNIAARDWANAHSGTAISGITATSLAVTRSSIAAWVENGEPLSALVRELEPFFGRSRADLIASTEVTRAYARANREAYRAAGVVGKMRWNTANDERVCPVCGPLHGTEVDLDAGFSFPDGVPPAHPRCRCMVLPVVDRTTIQSVVGAPSRSFDNEVEADAWAIPAWKSWVDGLTDEERGALRAYSEQFYREFNTALRGDMVDFLPPDTVEKLNTARAALARAEVPENVEGARTFGNFDLSQFSVGDKFRDDGFTSVSLNRNYGGLTGNLAIIEVPAGSRGGYLGGFSEFKQESELVLHPGTVFEVVGFRDGPNRVPVLRVVADAETKAAGPKRGSGSDKYSWNVGDLVRV